MKLSSIFMILALGVSALGTSQNQNSERITISLGGFDEGLDSLEMIPASKRQGMVNEKLENFHNFVKQSKVMKHPWEKLFIKSIEYRKSEQSYRKMIHDTINKMRDFNKKRKLSDINAPYKRQLPGTEDTDDGEDENEGSNAKEHQKPDGDLKREYEAQIVQQKEDGKAFRYSDRGKPEENAREAFEKIIDVRVPENCTNVTGFGVQSVECVIKGFETQEMTGWEAAVQFIKIFAIWGCIYLSVAIPLWCITGWGCCCITWKYCRPQKIVEEVRRYITDNPPGVYMNDLGEEEHYAPSLKERELYNNLSRKILRM